MKNNISNLDLAAIGEKDAKVAEKSAPKESKKTRAKTLRSMPSAFFDAHEKLVNRGDTTLDFSNYIVEAVREKLKRDGAI